MSTVNPIIVPTTALDLPTPLVVVSAETMARVYALAAEAHAAKPTDAAGVDAGNAIFRQVDALLKGIAEKRLEITRPIDEFKAKIIEAEKGATVPLAAAREQLGLRLRACESELRRLREEAERKARAEAERAAAEERARREAEYQAKLAEQRKAQALAQEAAKREAELFGVDPEPVAEIAAPAPPAPVVAVVRTENLPAMPAGRSAVRAKTDHNLVIDDVELIPVALAGKRLLVPDEKAIKALLKVGVAVPGCRLVTTEGIASSGARG